MAPKICSVKFRKSCQIERVFKIQLSLMIFILPHKKDHCPALHHYAFNCKWSYNSYLKLSPARCWGRIALDYFRFMWQVTHSCFGFIRYIIRTLTTSLDYFTAPAFVCLNKPDHLIHCICPESEVVTYTIVCCKRQAASNPIGLNLHLDCCTRLPYILLLESYLAMQ